MIRNLVAHALRGISHPNTDLDAQTFLMRVRAIRAEAGAGPAFAVSYRPQVTAAELDDAGVLIWDIGRSHDPQRGNFDHHQDPALGATPMILQQALGVEPTALDLYVDRADRGYFFKHPQPIPFIETLHGLAAGINLVHADDQDRSVHYQDLLSWVEQAGIDPYERFTEQILPQRFHLLLEARRAEEAVAAGAAESTRWLMTRIGKIAYIESDVVGVMRVLYSQGAALVILHEPRGRMSGWSSTGRKFTVGANPAVVSIPDQLDLRPLFAKLSTLEPSGNTWGGQAGVGGSPREDGGSGIPAEQVIREVRNYLS